MIRNVILVINFSEKLSPVVDFELKKNTYLNEPFTGLLIKDFSEYVFIKLIFLEVVTWVVLVNDAIVGKKVKNYIHLRKSFFMNDDRNDAFEH